MDNPLIDRLFDPTFNSCTSDEEFQLAWAVQARVADAAKGKGAQRGPPPKDRWSVRRRQASERDAEERLRAQSERVDPAVHVFEDEEESGYAAVRAEVPASVRVDGWTAHRRILFLEILEEHGSILRAAHAAGMSRRSVNRLLPRAPAFAAAFETAVRGVTATLADTLFDRAIHGHQVLILHDGDVVATRTVHHDMLGLYLLRVRDPLNYAPAGEAKAWLANHGLTPLARREEPLALPPATGDIQDLVQETPALPADTKKGDPEGPPSRVM